MREKSKIRFLEDAWKIHSKSIHCNKDVRQAALLANAIVYYYVHLHIIENEGPSMGIVFGRYSTYAKTYLQAYLHTLTFSLSVGSVGWVIITVFFVPVFLCMA